MGRVLERGFLPFARTQFSYSCLFVNDVTDAFSGLVTDDTDAFLR